jgi:phosphate starvation-inducible protein PhoH
MVITGDPTQNDMPKHVENGLEWAVDKLRAKLGEVGLVEFSPREIVRNPLIAKMLQHLEGATTLTEDEVPKVRGRGRQPSLLGK